jgi:hypothetical protein
MSRKKARDLDDAFELHDGPDEEVASAALDPLFNRYFRPELPEEEASEEENFIEAVAAENQQLQADLQRADQHQNRFLEKNKKAVDSGVDTDYYLTIVFVSEAQKLAFLKQAGWEQYGGARFLNGVQMARDMGIDLEEGYLATDSKADKRLTKFTKSAKKGG